MQKRERPLPRLLQTDRLLLGEFLRRRLDIPPALRVRFQPLQDLRAKLGDVVRGHQAVVGFVGDLDVILLEKGVQDLLQRAVPRQRVDIDLDVRVQALKARNQRLRVLGHLPKAEGVVAARPGHRVDRVNIALILRFLFIFNADQGAEDGDRVVAEAGSLDIAVVGIRVDPAAGLQLPEHKISLIPRGKAFAVLRLRKFGVADIRGHCGGKIFFQLADQDIPLHAESELTAGYPKKDFQAFPVHHLARRGERAEEILGNDGKQLFTRIHPIYLSYS